MEPVEIDNSNKIRVRIILALIVCVGALTYAWYLFGSYLSPTVKRNKAAPVQNNIPQQPNPQILSKVKPPKVEFRQYEVKAPSPRVPDQSKVLTFKTNYTTDEARTFAARFGLNEEKPSTENKDYVIYTNTDNPDKRGIMTFNLKTGSFSFQSLGDHRPSLNVGVQAPLLAASIFVKDIGLDDGNITCANTYERKDIHDAIFVKCNRDPAKIGGEIYGYPGILSVGEDIPFQKLKTGSIESNAPANDQITNTSDNTDGKVQGQEFNTITVALSKRTGKILSVQSSLRQTVSQEQIQNNEYISPEDALDTVKKGGAEQSLVIPAGSGMPSWQNVFANNQAVGKNATITDYVLGYLEKPGFVSQTRLVPYYIVRGLSQLESGYTARFVQIVPATRNRLSFLTEPTVAGVSTFAQAGDNYQYGSQKQGSFEVGTTQSPEPALTQSPQPTQPPAGPQLECRYPESWMNVTLQVPGVGEMKLGRSSAHMFFFMSANFPVSSVEQAITVFDSLVVQQYAINLARWHQSSPAMFNTNLNAGSLKPIYQSINNSIRSAIPGNSSDPSGYQMPNNLPNTLYYAEAPEFLQSDPRIEQPLDERRRRVYEQVDNTFIQNVQNAQISALASQPNIFPTTVLNGFYFVLSGTGSNTPWENGTCYLSGSTPSLFIYADKPTELTIKTGAPVTYAYPKLKNNTWNVALKNHQLFPHSYLLTSDSYLYYEYDHTQAKLTPQNEGFIIPAQTAEEWLKNTLSPQLGLTSKEEAQFVNELKYSMKSVKSPYVKISIANKNEVNSKLPLQFSTQPDRSYRIHLIVEERNEKLSIVSPTLQPLTRDGLTVLELGSTHH